MNAQLKKYWLVISVLLANGILTLSGLGDGAQSLKNASDFLWEVLQILPAVTLLMGLFDVWVPRSLVEQNIGPGSGLLGMLLSVLLGTAAAGPLYIAFPIAVSLLNKGARMANISIFLGSWATIKIPMLLMESTFIGLRFALIRLALTLPGVLIVGVLMERFVPVELMPCRADHQQHLPKQ